MDVLEAINTRHSYRGKYTSDPVPRKDLIAIMEAGLNAPWMTRKHGRRSGR